MKLSLSCLAFVFLPCFNADEVLHSSDGKYLISHHGQQVYQPETNSSKEPKPHPTELQDELSHQEHPKLQTFFISGQHLPSHESRVAAGSAIIRSIQEDSIINLSTDGLLDPSVIATAFRAQKKFFNMDLEAKMACQNNQSYAGYVYSGEEDTGGKKDAAEIFTVTRTFAANHTLVQQDIPCHGPTPWPSIEFESAMTAYANAMRETGTVVLRLIALGLGMDEHAFDDLTVDSWGHMRVLKFRERSTTTMPGIGSHTDYGMLVLASQDNVGGLWVRPHNGQEERANNWETSAAGAYENDDGWKFVVPEPNVLTCFPGDMLQFITRGKLQSTPHKVELANEERYAIAYFHEPSFGAVIQVDDERVHYGEHFTSMFERCYPEKQVTQRIRNENLRANLAKSVTGVHKF